MRCVVASGFQAACVPSAACHATTTTRLLRHVGAPAICRKSSPQRPYVSESGPCSAERRPLRSTAASPPASAASRSTRSTAAARSASRRSIAARVGLDRGGALVTRRRDGPHEHGLRPDEDVGRRLAPLELSARGVGACGHLGRAPGGRLPVREPVAELAERRRPEHRGDDPARVARSRGPHDTGRPRRRRARPGRPRDALAPIASRSSSRARRTVAAASRPATWSTRASAAASATRASASSALRCSIRSGDRGQLGAGVPEVLTWRRDRRRRQGEPRARTPPVAARTGMAVRAHPWPCPLYRSGRRAG